MLAGPLSVPSGKKKEPKPKLFGPDIFGCGGGLPHEWVGAKKFGMSLETREIKFFWRDTPGFCWDIPAVPEKFEKKKFVFNFRPLLQSQDVHPEVGTSEARKQVRDAECSILQAGHSLRFSFCQFKNHRVWVHDCQKATEIGHIHSHYAHQASHLKSEASTFDGGIPLNSLKFPQNSLRIPLKFP